MNNKDREALDKFLDEDSLSPEDTKRFAEMSDGERATFIAERFFEAGSKHGRSQLNEIRDDNMSELYDLIKKLKEDNTKLVEALKFYDSYNSPYTETFELVRNTDDAEYAGIFKLNDSEILQDGSDSCNLFSGKLARQVLKEIGEE